MITLDEIANDIRNKMRGGRSANSDPMSLEQIKHNIEMWRGLLIRRDDNNDIRGLEQTMHNMTVERMDFSSDPVYNDQRNMLRTSVRIPSIVRMQNRIPLSVRTPGANDIYPVIDHSTLPLQRYNRFANKPKAFLLDGYVWIDGDAVSRSIDAMISGDDQAEFDVDKEFSIIDIVGVFERPTNVMQLNGVNRENTGSQEYPITADMVQRITEGIIKGDMQMMVRTEEEKGLVR